MLIRILIPTSAIMFRKLQLYFWGDNIFHSVLQSEIDHEIFSTVILSLPLIQEGKLSVTCERMCTEYCLNRLIGLSLSRKSAVRLTDRPNMTLAVDRGR